MNEWLKNYIEEQKRPRPIPYDVLRRVVRWLEDAKGSLDDETIWYQKEKKWPCTYDEFKELWKALDKAYFEGNEEKYEVKKSSFPEYQISFTFEGVNFVWRLLIGQGSATQLFHESAWKDKVKFKPRKAILLYEPSRTADDGGPDRHTEQPDDDARRLTDHELRRRDERPDQDGV